MNLDIVARLITILKGAPEIGAIEIRRGLFGVWTSVRVSKAGHSPNAGPHIGVAQTSLTTLPPSSPVPRSAAGEGSRGPGEAVAAPPVSQLLEIKSPMVGTFYRSPDPGAEAYVKVGSRVTQGQVVCIIEAMKIMNEIESDYTGVVKEIALENMQPVEFGQVLFRVDPNA